MPYARTREHAGIIASPNIGSMAANLAAQTSNVIASTKIGCIWDDGLKCRAGYSGIYNQVKSGESNPCHALHCPLFSAYRYVREYRVSPPGRIPAALSGSAEIPVFDLGLFDTTLNHSIPSVPTEWRLMSWKPATGWNPGLVNDPDFLTDWKNVSNINGSFTIPSGLDLAPLSSG